MLEGGSTAYAARRSTGGASGGRAHLRGWPCAAFALCALAVAVLVSLAAPVALSSHAHQSSLARCAGPLVQQAYAADEQDIGSALDGRIIRLTPTGKTHEVNIHNDGYAIGNDVRTYFLGTSSKLRLVWDSDHNAYAIGYYQQFDERSRGAYYFDVDGQKTKDDTVVHVWKWNGDNSSMFWRFYKNDDGTFYIKNCRSGTYLGLEKNTDGNDVKLIITSTRTKWDVEVITEPLSNSAGNSLPNTYAPARDWMSHLPDSTPLSEVTMPGTHDTGTCNMPDFGAQSSLDACQKYYVDEQLNVGVRAFDLRLGGDLGVDDPFIIHNSIAFPCQDRDASYLRFSDVMAYFKEFLHAHPGETLLVCVKNDEGSDKAITQAVERYIKEDGSVIWDGEGIPTLGQARGKVVLLRRYQLEGNTLPAYRFGFDLTTWDNNNYPGSTTPLQIYSQTDADTGQTAQVWVQDYYGTDGETKIGYVRDSLDWASSHSFGDATRAYVYNYASCTKSNPFSAARYVNSHLITDARWQNYGTSSAKKEFLGIVMMDFIDGTWARNIYLKNFMNCDMDSVEFPAANVYAYEPAKTAELTGGRAPDNCRFVATGEQTFTMESERPQVSVDCVDGDGNVLCSAVVPATVKPRPVTVIVRAKLVTFGDVRIDADDPYDEQIDVEVVPRGDDAEATGLGLPDGVGKDALGTVFYVEGAPLAAGSYRSVGSYKIVACASPNPNFEVRHVWDTSHGYAATYEVTPLYAQFSWSGYENLTYSPDPRWHANVTATVTNLPKGVDPSTCRPAVEGGDARNAGDHVAKVAWLEGENGWNGNVRLPGSDDCTRAYAIEKATPTAMMSNYPVNLVYGETPGDQARAGAVLIGSTYVPATYVFADPNAELPAGKHQVEAVATPQDSANVNAYAGMVDVAVAKRPVSVRVLDATSVYGDALPEATWELAAGSAPAFDDAPEDVVTGVRASYGDGAQSDYVVDGTTCNATPAGEYSIEADVALGDNYELDAAYPGRLTIAPRMAQLTWENCGNRYLNDGKGNPTASVGNAIPRAGGGTDDVRVVASEPDYKGTAPHAQPGTGLYEVRATGLEGASAANYLLPADAARMYTVRVDPGDYAFPAQARMTYGDALEDVALEGGSGEGSFKVDLSRGFTVTASDGTPVGNVGALTQLDAGTYTLSADVSFWPAGAVVPSSHERVDIALTVGKKRVVAWAVSATKAYGDPLGTYQVACRDGALAVGYDGVADTVDDLKVTVDAYDALDSNEKLMDTYPTSGQFNCAPVGNYPLRGEQRDASSGNYDVTVIPGTLAITARLVDLAWEGAGSQDDPLVYTGKKQNVTARVRNIVPDDSAGVQVTVTGGDAENAGMYQAQAVELTGDAAGNYRLPGPGEVGFEKTRCAYTVNKADPVVTWPTGIDAVYGQQLADAQLTGQSACGADGSDLEGRFVFAADQGSFYPDAGEVAVDGSGEALTLEFHPDDAVNYNAPSKDGGVVVRVARKPVTVAVGDVTTAFGDAKPAPSLSVDRSQLARGDTADDLSVELSYTDADGKAFSFDAFDLTVTAGKAGGAWNRAPVGDYDVRAESTSANYEVTFTGSQAPDEGVVVGAVARARVEPRAVALAWSGFEGLAYTGEPAQVSAAAGNLVPCNEAGDLDRVDVVVEGGDAIEAGDYVARATGLREGASPANYRLPDDGVVQPYSIAKVAATGLVCDPVTLVYGETPGADARECSLWANGALVPATYAFEDAAAQLHAGDHELAVIATPVSDEDKRNVEALATTVAVRVEPRHVSVRGVDAVSTYGDALPAAHWELVEGSALAFDDAAERVLGVAASFTGASGNYAVGGGEFNATPAGEYAVDVATQPNGDYVVDNALPGCLTIVPRTARLVWENCDDRCVGDGKGDPAAMVDNALLLESGHPDDVGVAVSAPEQVGEFLADGSGVYRVQADALTGDAQGNYVLPTNAARFYTVRGADVEHAFPTQASLTYGDALAELVLEDGSGDGTFEVAWGQPFTVTKDGVAVDAPAGAAATVLDVGTYELSVTVVFHPTDGSGKPDVERQATIALTVHPKRVVAWAQRATKAYGEALGPYGIACREDALVGDDTVADLNVSVAAYDTAQPDQTLASAYDVTVDAKTFNRAPVGSYPVRGTQAEAAGNYNVIVAPGTLSVTPLLVELAWDGASDLRYTGGPAQVVARVANAVPADAGGSFDDVSVQVRGGDAVDAGSYRAFALSLQGDAAGNYRLADISDATFAQRWCGYRIAKAVPNPVFPGEGTAVLGEAVSSAVFGVPGASDVPGTFAFQDPDIPVREGTNGYPMTFAPDDARNYESVDGWGTVTAVDPPSGGGASGEGGAPGEGGGGAAGGDGSRDQADPGADGSAHALAPTGDATFRVALACASLALGAAAVAACALRRARTQLGARHAR